MILFVGQWNESLVSYLAATHELLANSNFILPPAVRVPRSLLYSEKAQMLGARWRPPRRCSTGSIGSIFKATEHYLDEEQMGLRVLECVVSNLFVGANTPPTDQSGNVRTKI